MCITCIRTYIYIYIHIYIYTHTYGSMGNNGGRGEQRGAWGTHVPFYVIVVLFTIVLCYVSVLKSCSFSLCNVL